MNIQLNDINLVRKWADQMGGVFSLSDLKNLLDEKKTLRLQNRVKSLIKNNALVRFKREFYITEACKPPILAQRIDPESYISLGTALAHYLLIGSVPAKTIYSVRPGRTRTFSGQFGSLVYLGITPDLLFGYQYENGIRYATAEKAYLDTLYYYQKGHRFSFNVFTDINIESLNRATINTWLKKYRNPKFVTFVKGVLSA